MTEMMEITIEVTEYDIIQGVPRLGCLCPIYWAAERKLNDIEYPHDEIVISACHMKVVHGQSIRSYGLPVEAMAFIRRFDSDESVEPFNFNISIVKNHG